MESSPKKIKVSLGMNKVKGIYTVHFKSPLSGNRICRSLGISVKSDSEAIETKEELEKLINLLNLENYKELFSREHKTFKDELITLAFSETKNDYNKTSIESIINELYKNKELINECSSITVLEEFSKILEFIRFKVKSRIIEMEYNKGLEEYEDII